MLNKVEKESYKVLGIKFQNSVANFPLINAVLNHVQEGLVYSDKNYEILIVVTKSGFSLVDIIQVSSSKCEMIFGFLQRNIEIPSYIHLYDPSRVFIEFLCSKWDKFKIRERIQYRYENKVYHNIEELLPENYSWDFISNIPFHKLEQFDLKLDSRYWNSKSDFFEKAIGACILDQDDNLAAICYSACVVGGFAEMDTLVLEKYRGKGLMRLVSMPFFNISREKGYITHWDTFIENKASFIMGEKFLPNSRNNYKLVSVLLREMD